MEELIIYILIFSLPEVVSSVTSVTMHPYSSWVRIFFNWHTIFLLLSYPNPPVSSYTDLFGSLTLILPELGPGKLLPNLNLNWTGPEWLTLKGRVSSRVI